MLELIKKELKKYSNVLEPEVFVSEKEDFGHYSTNLAFKLAPSLRKSPMEIANDLARKLSNNPEFEKVEAAMPGFLNFWLAQKLIQKELAGILKNKSLKLKIGGKKLKINLEFVSANPTGPLTMANGRGGFYGDVLGNVL